MTGNEPNSPDQHLSGEATGTAAMVPKGVLIL